MPSYLKPGQIQHEDLQANIARTVTESRWVVESYHKRLKQLVSNFFIDVNETLLKTVTACLNGIRGLIYVRSQEKYSKIESLLKKMKARLSVHNSLAQRVKEEPEL